MITCRLRLQRESLTFYESGFLKKKHLSFSHRKLLVPKQLLTFSILLESELLMFKKSSFFPLHPFAMYVKYDLLLKKDHLTK